MDSTVLVVGGGATGVGVARDLSRRGVDVTLVERGALASGTTGRSHGVLHSGARYAEADPDGAAACLEENRILRDVAAGCVRETGGYFLSLDGDDPDYFDEKRAACESVGMETETLSGDELRERVPGASPAVTRALRVPDGVVSPARLVVANASDARAHGAEIRTHSPLRDLHVEDGRVVAADVGGRVGRLAVDAVVNAAGPWAGQCAALAGVDVAMRPTRGVMVAVEAPDLGAVCNRCRPPADGDIVVPQGDEAVLGTTSVVVSDPDDYQRADWEVERTVAECAAMVPGLEGCDVRRTYWGVRPLYDPDEAARDEARGISRDFALLDHADEGAAGLFSIVGGKLTTYRRMAEATTDRVCAHLGVDAACRTADAPLPGSDDPAELDSLLGAFGVDAPADGL